MATPAMRHNHGLNTTAVRRLRIFRLQLDRIDHKKSIADAGCRSYGFRLVHPGTAAGFAPAEHPMSYRPPLLVALLLLAASGCPKERVANRPARSAEVRRVRAPEPSRPEPAAVADATSTPSKATGSSSAAAPAGSATTPSTNALGVTTRAVARLPIDTILPPRKKRKEAATYRSRDTCVSRSARTPIVR